MPKSSKSFSGSNIRTDRCFNPFYLPSHRKIKNLQKVSKIDLVELHLPVTDESLKQKICSGCRIKVSKLKKNPEKSSEVSYTFSCKFLYYNFINTIH